MQQGTKKEFVYPVKPEDLASAVGVGAEDEFPEVLATSRVIGLMEVAAARLLQPLLKPGELSVGVGIDIKHFAPTPVNEEVKVVATFTAQDGKLYLFAVEVFDSAGKVASGKHSRAIVNKSRLLDGAQARMTEVR